MYKVYGRLQNRASRVIWLLEELGQEYELIDAGPHDPRVLALNPSGKVPILDDDGMIVTDSSAIMTYLADKHGELTYPAGTKDRAQQDSLFFALLDDFDAVLWMAARHKFVLPEDKRVPEVKPSLAWEFNRNVRRMAERFRGPFLQGDKMTIADILCVHCMNWAHGAKLPIEDDTLVAYAREMRQRPAFRRMAALAKQA